MPTMFTYPDLVTIALIGLIAGTLGGMLGVGGSVIMIPGLTLLLGRNQHLYQAAAMIANVAVAVPAAMRHRRSGAMQGKVLAWMAPGALVCVLLGVWVSNLDVFSSSHNPTDQDGGIWLGRILAAFLVYVIYLNIKKLLDGSDHGAELSTPLKPTKPRSLAVGSIMGSVAGLLGIGGGAVAVPLQQVLLKLPLRQAIANSTAVICISAAVGATYKNLTLGQQGYGPTDGLLLGLLLAPTAYVGGRLGASLTHRLPLRQVRMAFIALMIVAAWKMAALGWGPL